MKQLLVFIVGFLMSSQTIFAKTRVFFIEATMPTTPWTFGLLKHHGIGFQDEHQYLECHFTEKGLMIVKDGDYPREILRKEEFAEGPQDVITYVNWCRQWAAKRAYTLAAFDCWTLVHDFCKTHHIENRRIDHANWFRNLFMIRGVALGLTYSKLEWRHHKIKSIFYATTLPLAAVGHSLYSTLRVGLRDSKRLFKKIFRSKKIQKIRIHHN